jgi:hypothetical protein
MRAGFATPVTARQAETAVARWLRRTPAPMGTPVGSAVLSSTVLADETGTAHGHLVRLRGGGFVVTSADDRMPPVIAFSGHAEAVQDEHHPLWDILKQDMAQRQAAAQVRPPARHSATLAADSHESAAADWAALLDEGVPRETQGVASISDVRVAPLVQSKWGQKTAGGINTYNRSTPVNYPCGCVATVGAQLMRYHGWPESSVPQTTFSCKVDGTATSLTLFGGPYAWQAMPFVPDSLTPTAQRDAISTLTRDVGVAVHMRYAPSVSDTHTPLLAAAFTNTFGYASACVISDYESGVDGHLPNAVLANLDAGFPVGLSIKGSSGGHAVVGDGYGFSGGLLYVHLNMGWSGNDDVWYNLPVFDTTYYSFSILRSIVYNVFPEWPGAEIISGRATDASGAPLPGIDVVPSRIGGGVLLAPTITDANGIYSLAVPSPVGGAGDTWRIVAYDGGMTLTQTVAVAASVSTHYTYNETAGTYSDPPGDGTVGNRWGVDFLFSAYPTITTGSLPAATIGVAYSATLSAAGGVPPYRWEISQGVLPPGISLDGGGTLSGTPTATGSYPVEFRVLNHNNDLHTTATLTLVVNGTDAWTYDPAAGTLSHSSTPWVLDVSANGFELNVLNVRVRATVACRLPLGDPVSGGYFIVAIQGRPGNPFLDSGGVFYGGEANAPGYHITAVTFPDTLTSIGLGAFAHCTRWTGMLNLPPYVREIGNYAFMYCSGLTGDLVLPETLVTLKGGSFSGCRFSCKTVTIPSSLTTLEGNTFSWAALTGPVFVPDSITTYGIAPINGANLREISVPSSGVSFSINAFSSYAALTHVTFRGGYPHSVASPVFGRSTNAVAYIYYAYLSSWQPRVSGDLLAGTAVWQGQPIRIIDMPTTMSEVTFDPQGGTAPTPAATTHVTNGMPYGPLPSTTYAGHAFAGWWTAPSGGVRVTASALVTATADHTLFAHWVADGWAYDPDAGTISHGTVPWVLAADAAGTDLTVTGVFSQPTAPARLPLEDPVEDGYRIAAIGELAFALNAAATGDLVIPDTVSTIGEGAFYGCRGFNGSLTLPDSITAIARKAFFDCSGFVGPLILPRPIRELSDGVFAGCSGFTGHLAVPAGVTNIDHEAFVNCNGLTSLHIPASVEQIRQLAFYVCDNLREVIYACDYNALIVPYYFNLDTVTSYVYAANSPSWAPFVDDGPITSGHASWNGRPIRVLETCDAATAGTPAPVPYAWLLAFNGLVSQGDFEAAAGGDADGDGMKTWAEYVAGSDPTNAASVFLTTIDAQRNIHWSPDLGDRLYTVEGKASLTEPEWRTPDAACRFFRVRVELPKP